MGCSGKKKLHGLAWIIFPNLYIIPRNFINICGFKIIFLNMIYDISQVFLVLFGHGPPEAGNNIISVSWSYVASGHLNMNENGKSYVKVKGVVLYFLRTIWYVKFNITLPSISYNSNHFQPFLVSVNTGTFGPNFALKIYHILEAGQFFN